MTIAALNPRDLGMTLGALMIPLVGLILLIVGFVERTRSQKQPPQMPPAYPGQLPPTAQPGSPYPPPPPGYGPQMPPGYPPSPPTPTPGGAPYPPPPGHWPPPRKPKPKGTALIVTGAVILGVSLFGGVVRAADSSDASADRTTVGHLGSSNTLKVGQCVADSDFGKGAPKPTDCDDPSAVMELVYRGGANANCPDGKGRDDTDYTTLFWDNATMCFVANFQKGQCYAVNTANPSESPFTHQDCDDPRGAVVKVVQRFDGTTNVTQCSPGTKPISYEKPARLFCLKAAQ